MNIINENSALIVRFPNDKISKKDRQELANHFAMLLHMPVIVFDKDAELTIIEHKAIIQVQEEVE